MRNSFMFMFVFLSCAYARAQEVWMHPNDGQWDERIEFKVELGQGEFLIEKDGFTYFLNDARQKVRGANHKHEGHQDEHEESETFEAQVIRSKFIGSSWAGKSLLLDSSTFYRNYILGNDESKWKSHLHSYSLVELEDYYPGIDMVLDGNHDKFKYSFRVDSGIDAAQIQFSYKGENNFFLDDDGNMHIVTRFGEIIEGAPVAWEINEETGVKNKVTVNYEIRDGVVGLEFPDGYDTNNTLIIDPDITFSTFTGSSVDNWGMTATPDNSGNLFGGGVAFGLGYPISTGAYDGSFNGGSIDLAISKFNANGTALLYSTYIGGSGSETPNSMICSSNDELYIFGITSSFNFPMAGVPYDASFNSGPDVSSFSNGLGFTEGADLYVARLSADGSSLLASTFVGGSNTDGLNIGPLNYNYGDQFRGEIILDDAGDVYVASTTRSSDFPTVQGAQGSLGGGQDAVVFKMPPSLSALTWSTFFGGSSEETGNSVQVNSAGNVYFVGGTSSSGLSFPSGHDLSYNGGFDGYIAQLNGTNGSMVSGSYMGQSEYDQTYFVQIDLDDSVYVYGQTESSWSITPGHYGNANSGQYILKYSGDLTSRLWTTLVGAGTGHAEISPTAFLVSDCYDIYLSGWGGQLNVSYSQAVNSTTVGFPVTSNGYQTTTTGSNFYIAVLGRNALNLKYGTYMGGMVTTSPNHVDGGTSRFDKNGYIYHAVCGSCGVNNNNGFATTPGVWSPTSMSNNCNMAVFKFELSTIEAVVSTPQTVICIPDPAIFDNNSANGNAFYWDFGDNNTSTEENPVHLYAGPGDYDVTLIVIDTNNCYVSDTVEFTVHIGDFQGTATQPSGPICPGTPYQLEAMGGSIYEWTPANVLDDPTSATPIATVDVTTDFMVIISDTCGIDTAYVTLPVHQASHTIVDDLSICIGNSVDLFATGGVDYLWSPPDYLDDPTSATPHCTPDVTTEYFVTITTSNNCIIEDTVLVEVYYTPPIPIMPDSIFLCEGESVTINVSGGVTYDWSPNQYINTVVGSTVVVSPPNDMFYYCDFTNPCGTVPDSVFIDIVEPTIVAGNDTIICPGESADLWVTGGISYYWSPANSLSATNTSLVTATPSSPTAYVVTGYDQYGCSNSDTVYVDLFPLAFIQTSPDVYALYGDVIELSATSTTSGDYIWYPPEFLSCVVCPNPIANPDQNYWYIVSYTDENGCTASDSVHIYYDPILYVPNTFTPNDDVMNQVFKARGGNFNSFEMLIFDRWGELIFTSDDVNIGWDGTYLGNICQDGTYVWKINLTDFNDEEHRHVGHVNLIR